MPIISSTIMQGPPQVDGRIPVTESHVHSSGQKITHTYLAASTLDLQMVLAERAARIGAEMDQREAAIAESMNYEVPLSALEFLSRLTPAEFAAWRNSADPIMQQALQMLQASAAIYRSSHRTQQMLGYAVMIGLLSQARAVEVLA